MKLLPRDNAIFTFLQNRGFIKNEAKAIIEREIYRLQLSDRERLKSLINEGADTQQVLDDIRDKKREAFLAQNRYMN